MDSLNSNSISGEVKRFSEHREACNYAKTHQVCIVISSGQGWIVGDRCAVFDLKKQESLGTNNSTKNNRIENQSNAVSLENINLCECLTGEDKAKKKNNEVIVDKGKNGSKSTNNCRNKEAPDAITAKHVDASVQHGMDMISQKDIGVPRKINEASENTSKSEKVLRKLTEEKSLRCKHCGDAIFAEVCEKGCNLIDECLDCHNEIQHKIIKNANIHIIGGHGGPRGGAQEDWSDSFDDMEPNSWEEHYSKFAWE
jgi:hypothetical protein